MSIHGKTGEKWHSHAKHSAKFNDLGRFVPRRKERKGKEENKDSWNCQMACKIVKRIW